MEFIHGKTLTQVVAEEKVNLEQIVGIWLQLIKVVYYVHEKGVVHNAINPDNIIII
jgi:serine/threonine protein kinase